MFLLLKSSVCFFGSLHAYALMQKRTFMWCSWLDKRICFILMYHFLHYLGGNCQKKLILYPVHWLKHNYHKWYPRKWICLFFGSWSPIPDSITWESWFSAMVKLVAVASVTMQSTNWSLVTYRLKKSTGLGSLGISTNTAAHRKALVWEESSLLAVPQWLLSLNISSTSSTPLGDYSATHPNSTSSNSLSGYYSTTHPNWWTC